MVQEDQAAHIMYEKLLIQHLIHQVVALVVDDHQLLHVLFHLIVKKKIFYHKQNNRF
jgi:hypothetical protein